MKKNGEIKVCLVGSSGGHLTHLYMLKPFWKDKNRFWVTFDKEDPSSEDLVDLKGNHIPRKSVLLDCLEAGEAAYMDRRNSYEILNG